MEISFLLPKKGKKNLTKNCFTSLYFYMVTAYSLDYFLNMLRACSLANDATLAISEPYEGIKEMLEEVGESQNHALVAVTSLKMCLADQIEDSELELLDSVLDFFAMLVAQLIISFSC